MNRKTFFKTILALFVGSKVKQFMEQLSESDYNKAIHNLVNFRNNKTKVMSKRHGDKLYYINTQGCRVYMSRYE